VKISASIYSNKERPLEDLVKSLEECGVDYLHVDCNDDPGVEEAIARCRAVSKLPIDLHVISPEPEKYYPIVARHKVEWLTVQFEDLKGRVPEFPDLGCEYGLSVTTHTPNEVFTEFADPCDFILFMTTTPGQSGGTFNSSNFKKIRSFKRQFPGKRIHVDGGVNAEISFVLRNLGVYSSVSGSFLVNAPNLPLAFLKLLVQKQENHLFVEEVMHGLDELPVVRESDLGLEALLQTMEAYRMGYCLIVDQAGRLSGAVTNADVRSGLLREIKHHGARLPQAGQLVNRNPKTILAGTTISGMLQAVKGFPFLVQFLPVVDNSNRLMGSVNFNQLILGEL
jgi:pentose-5-phosphate-3-epimerase/CBS domain-containing protein